MTINSPGLVRFDISQLNAHVVQSLLPHVGPGVASANFGPILVKMVECTLYPYTDYDRKQITTLLMEYGLDEEVSGVVISNLHPMIYRMVSTVFQRYIGECLFEVSQDSQSTVLVRNLGFIPSEEEVTGWNVDRYVDKMYREIENGDYIPERMRRQVGLA